MTDFKTSRHLKLLEINDKMFDQLNNPTQLFNFRQANEIKKTEA